MSAETSGLQWKWVLIGALVVFAVQFALGIIMAIVAPDALLSLGTGQVTAGVAVVVLLLFFAGYFAAGVIVALLSPGLTLREPAIGAALAVAGTNLLGGNIGSVLLAWIIPFVVTLLGAKVGEGMQSRRAAG